jgi:Flp pilus assembly protein TadG
MMQRKLSRLARFGRNTSGAAAVEFAIISTVFITFIFGIIYLGIMLHTHATLQWAVENSVRRAIITGTVTQAQLTTTVNELLSSMHLPNADSVNYSVSGGAVPLATLTANMARSYTIPFVGTFNINHSATASMPQS